MMKLLGDSINNILRQCVSQKSKVLGEIIINWSKIVGQEFARDTSPTGIFSAKEKGQQINILYIRVNSSAIGLKLSYSQEMIIERIAIYFGHKAVHKIKMKVTA
jgi:hypothetical protein